MARHRASRVAGLVLAAATVAVSCAGPSDLTDPVPPLNGEVTSPEQLDCADVVDVVATAEASGSYRFDVTVRSPDTGWDKYADLWEVRAPDGAVLGERVLAHPHVDEQPFTRSQSGISIPAGVSTVTVVARDSVNGFCGQALQVDLP